MSRKPDDRPLDLKADRIQQVIDLFEPYFKNKLLPFWLDNSIDNEHGGYLTMFNRDGSKMDRTNKNLINQLRMIFTFASSHRAGYGEGRCVEAAKQGVDWVLENLWDKDYEGWYWITDRQGNVLDDSKIMYGHCFGVYSMAEYSLAIDDPRGWEYANKTFDVIQRSASDTAEGGYWEMFNRDWSLKKGGVYGGDRKTLDVHMHLMEAYTTLYEMTKLPSHRRKLIQLIEILLNKMVFPNYGTGIAQFDRQFNPLRAILFQNVWGADRAPDEEARPLDNTNYGHNIEMGWLLKHAIDILGENPEPYKPAIQKLADHAYEWGVDWKYGGIYVEGPNEGPAIQMLKEFWQQAEALVGFLDAAIIFEKQMYWDAFENIFDFVWNKMIAHDVGEWLALLERDGTVKWDHLAHEWKVSYHTVRATIQTIKRLKTLKKMAENKKTNSD